MTNIVSDKGILLKVSPFKEMDALIKVFTENHGIVSMVAKNALTKAARRRLPLPPFIEGEFFFKNSPKELKSLHEISAENFHTHLYKKYQFLDAACKIASILELTQLPLKPTPILYRLFTSYLKHIPTMNDPYLLADSFFLKLLRYEGLINISKICFTCKQICKTLCLKDKIGYCSMCCPKDSLLLSDQESSYLLMLLHCTYFEEVRGLTYNLKISDLIKKLYSEA